MVTTSDRNPRRRGRPPSGGRQAILDAALELVRQEGVANLTSRAVAARAGVSDASVYYHFNDRQGLLVAVFEYGIKPLKYLETVPEGSDWRAVLAAAFTTFEEFFTDLLPIVTSAHADADVARLILDYIAKQDRGPHTGVAYLASYLRDEQAAGRVNPDADVEAVAMVVINTATGRALRRLLMRPDESDPRIPEVDRMVATVAALLEPRPGASG